MSPGRNIQALCSQGGRDNRNTQRHRFQNLEPRPTPFQQGDDAQLHATEELMQA